MAERRELPVASDDLEKIRSVEHRGLYASGGPRYKDAIFGRDSIESAEDMLDVKPELAKEVILTMASFQGKVVNNLSEEEPGRIHHEHRSLDIRGKDVELSQESKDILKRLGPIWGGTEQEMTYYGSVDATPLYVRLVAEYCRAYGDSILDEAIVHHNGEQITIRQSLSEATDWVENRIKHSELGLLEYQRSNPQGHANPVWKDSSTSYIHENGELANHARPIASIELQGLSYDALKKAAKVLGNDPDYSGKAEEWEAIAEQLRNATLEKFWMEDRQFFAMGIDRDPRTNEPRQIETLSSNAGDLLDTTLFDDLPEKLKAKYISGIIKTLYSPEFVTDVGIRSQSLKYTGLVDYADYHGSWTAWIKETYDIAKGLRRQGFSTLADQLENRILNGVNVAGATYEFFYVDPQGRVDYDPQGKKLDRPGPVETIIANSIPEGMQAWTVSAVFAIKSRHGKHPVQNITPSPWQADLESRMLADSGVPTVGLMTDPNEIERTFSSSTKFYIDKVEGKKRSGRYRAMLQ